MNKKERREYLVSVFDDTQQKASDHYLPVTRKYDHAGIPYPQDFVNKDSVVSEDEETYKETYKEAYERIRKEAYVLFTRKGTIAALLDLRWSSLVKRPIGKVAVLNFASFKSPGGGAPIGSQAQEEDLCRCTNLYQTLADMKAAGHYPIGKHQLLYTENVVILKDEEYNDVKTPPASAPAPAPAPGLASVEPNFTTFDVISCAAIKRRSEHMPRGVNRAQFARDAAAREAEMDDEASEAMREKIDAIFRVAIAHNVRVLVLGPLGCGAYGNDPDMVSSHFRAAVDRYKRHFYEIIFPFKHDPNSQQSIVIYKAFHHAFHDSHLWESASDTDGDDDDD